ncbi:phosphonate C-P lyase system protein PhnL [Roseiterribacter gracilis]|uniref:Phosphonate C-P lyase system protein PhnL n=1 Tax=Roseiterribacter gracilis TaxID=2812848 RepID=A0A8S8X9T4_9PROT|nr:phosphonate C-P lyase system protein PhnL [Rhodospirillales bacterium TMPK1]
MSPLDREEAELRSVNQSRKENLLLQVSDLSKRFTLHEQGGVVLSVLDDVSLSVAAGECVALDGPSGAGKSTLLRCLYANYRADKGRILVQHGGEMIDLLHADARALLDIRRRTLGYVSQFLRVIPRVPTLDVVAMPLLSLGVDREEARDRAADLLRRVALPEPLWKLAPATFSGGEQQRVNIARGLVVGHPILLLDEPTASLDADNRARVLELITERRDAGAAIVGIFHDEAARSALATTIHPVRSRQEVAAA